MKSLERQLQEKDDEIRELRKATGQAAVTTALAESGLPDAAKARLRKRFKGTETATEIKTVIDGEREYIRQVRGSGWKPNKASARGAVDLVEASLVESYRRLGLSEKEAKIAAGIEDAVENISESQRRLIDSAKALGLTDEQAKHFADF